MLSRATLLLKILFTISKIQSPTHGVKALCILTHYLSGLAFYPFSPLICRYASPLGPLCLFSLLLMFLP